MKRRVMADRLSDLLEQKQQREAVREKREEQKKEYHKARDAVFNAAVDRVREYLSHYASDEYMSDMTIRISSSYGEGYECRIQYGESKVSDDDLALKWQWQATLNEDGSIAKESSSWSGLNSTTKTNIENLRATLNVLEALSDITDEQWQDFLTIKTPDIDDYVTEQYPKGTNSYKLDDDIWEATIANMIGTGKAVVDISNMSRTPTVDYLQNRAPAYTVLRPIGETPKRFRVEQYTIVNNENQYNQSRYVDTYQISKKKMHENTLSPDTFTVSLPSSLLHS